MNFQFIRQGTAYAVHTEVGNGIAQVQVTAAVPTRYAVIDRHTGMAVGNYGDRKRARRRADKLDLAYGAIRYGVREVPAC